MNLSSSTCSFLAFSINLLLISISLPRHVYSDEEKYRNCNSTFCGDKKIDYPFWGHQRPDYCGLEGFRVDCNDQNLTLDINNIKYEIIKINPDPPSLILKRVDFLLTNCPEPGQFFNTSLNQSPFGCSTSNANATVYYNCTTSETSFPDNNFTCSIGNINQQGYFLLSGIRKDGLDGLNCNISIVIAVLQRSIIDFGMGKITSVDDVVNGGFEVIWRDKDLEQCRNCNNFGGRCGHDVKLNRFSCFCPDNIPSCSAYFSQASDSATKPGTGALKWRWKIVLGSISGGIGILLAVTIICYIRRRNNSHVFSMSFVQNRELNNKNIEAFMKNHGSLVPRYSYANVRKITENFKEKLGQGGFGTVYKGKLLDGRLVAVKMLNETKGNGEEFINEVASISRTSHVNVVNLLGFCLDRCKRALIYEFMLNGSLDKFIGHENQHQNKDQNLRREKLYEISVGVAQGLEYLHRGCNTRIVHFDIKPQNILLDKDFYPKISDFGLAKLCTREKSILSMLEARGTIGYIAPEVFNRNFGGVSHKSDVYSYGMMLLEMVGERTKNDSGETDHSSEKYFPYWVYKDLELNKFGDHSKTSREDEISKKLAIIGLWCIQTSPSDRPSMNKVIEMLEGNTEILEVPPKPFLSSPTRSALDSCKLSLS